MLVKIKSMLLTPFNKEDQAAFRHKTLEENYKKTIPALALLLLVEITLYLNRNLFQDIQQAILAFIIADLLWLPILILLRKNLNKTPYPLAQGSLILSAAAILLFTATLSLSLERGMDMIHVYMMGIIGVATFLTLPGALSLPLFTLSTLAFSIALKQHSHHPETYLVEVMNILIFTLLAITLNNILYRMRAKAYLDEKTLEERNHLLEDLIRRDTMTGLLSHKATYQHLDEGIQYTQQTGRPLCIAIIDIDNFKKINDTYGHVEGDKVLINIAAILRNNLRKTDILGRYGGDEFLAIMPETNLQDANTLLSRLNETISSQTNHTPPITISGGIAQYAGEPATELINKADALLYQAKETGRNRFCSNN